MGKMIQLFGFPSGVSAKAVLEWLERKTGKGSVYGMRYRQAKNGRRYYAIVQFEIAKDAELINSLANTRDLWYGKSYLNSRKMDHDIVLKARTTLHSLQNVGLYFGCKTGKEELSYFWCSDNVSVDFGIRIQKLICLLKYDDVEYQLELSYENIWQTELYSPRGRTAKKLLFQLMGAPRIFKKEADSSGQAYEDPFQNYCRETPDDQWVRTIDFTPSCAIGQSSALCLELPSGLQLPDFGENFPGYEEIVGDLITELCLPFFLLGSESHGLSS